MPPLLGDHDGSDDFLLSSNFCAPPGVTQFVRPIDAKARPKGDKHKMIKVILEIVNAVTGSQTTFGGLTISYVLRTLWRRRTE